MARPSQGRSEISPLSVRMSPTEREACRRKALDVGVEESELARMAIAAFAPQCNRITVSDSDEGNNVGRST
jgi:hypothetical protein